MYRAMERNEIIDELKNYFNIKELVCNHVFDRWGDRAWQFLDTDYLHCLLILRTQVLNAPMVCNNTATYQRGLRCNMCQLVKSKTSTYLSSHILGKAGDFTVRGMTAQEARELIKDYASLFPCQVRIEGGVSWLHFDVLPQSGVTKKVYEFSV